MEPSESLAALNRLFMQALLGMGDAGESDAACRLAAQGWSMLRHDYPKEAERLNGVMHSLTSPKRLSKKASPSGDKPDLSTASTASRN
ncbi:MAG TPA: hypothetical protein VHK70_04775 [Burkholderiaceae bacterium]|jgi:hypothetical protein|nr:hypothetical protein [Burkholderiaceae bacterium]